MLLEVKKRNTENKQKRPKYTLEFKKDAAKLVIEKGYTQEQAVLQTLNYHFSLKLRTIGRTISFKAILELNKN